MSSHAVKYRCTHKELEGDSGETTFLIEILEDGFVGSVTDVRGLGDVFRLSYDKIDARNPTENPIQKGRLEFNLAIEDSGDLSILTDFLAADEDQFQMRLKKDGNVLWTGYVLTDLIQYSEGDYPFVGKVVAKDLTRLSGIDFPLTDDRVTLIDTVADFLDDLSLGLDIYTYTSWTEQNTDGAVAGDYDFLNRIYNDRKAFRRFARTGDESDEKITLEEGLERFLRNYGLILRQEENAWKLYQITALDDPTSVFEAVYNSSGTQQSTSSQDLTVSIDRVNRYLLPASLNEINPGIKRVRNKYDHRTAVSNIAFPELVTLDAGNTSEDQEQLIISDGDQRLVLAGDIQADIPTGESNGRVQWRITIVTSSQTYYWDHGNTTWTNTTTINETDLTFVGPGAQTASSDLWIGSLDIETDNLPTDADGTMTVSLLRALSDSSFANETRWENVVFAIKNPVASENSDSIDYQLTQSGGFSTNFEIQNTWFGDGPNAYSPGALRHGSDDGDFTSDDWQRRGTTTGYRNLHENLLKEIVDTQRGPRRNLQADLWGNYSSANVISYDSKYFFFIGGDLTGRNVWDAQLLEVNIATGTDTFEDLPKFTDETGSGTGSTGGGSGGGLDQSTADARYFKQASLLSEASDLPTLRGNIGLGASDDVEFNSLDIGGSSFVDSSRNVTLPQGSLTTGSPSYGATLDLEYNTTGGFRFNPDQGFGHGPNIELIGEDASNSQGQAKIRYGSRHVDIDATQAFVVEELTGTAGSGLSERFRIGQGGGVSIDQTLTINGTQLFVLGNEQDLSDNATGVSFADLTLTNTLDVGGDITTRDDVVLGQFEDPSSAQSLSFQAGVTDQITQLQIVPSGTEDQVILDFINASDSSNFGAARFSLNDDLLTIGSRTVGTGTAIASMRSNLSLSINSALTSGSVLTVGGDSDFQGVLDAETIQTQTLRTTLFKPTTISGMGGEIVFSAVSTVVSIDTGANTIVVEDAVFSNGNSVVVSSAIYNQTGFSNVELNITSAGSAVSGGTQYSYTVNTGDEADIDKGDSVTRVNGDLVYINATEGAGSPRIAGYDNLSGFADSPLSGDTATAVWELNATGGKIGGSNIDINKQWSDNNDETFKGGGVLLDWSNERQSVGDNIGFDSVGTGYPDEIVVSTTTDATDALYAHPTDPAQASRNILDTTVSKGEVIRFKFSYEVSDNNLNGTWSWQWKIESFNGSTWEDPFATIDPVNAYLSGSTSFTEINSFTFQRQSTAASENRVFYVYFYPPDDTLRHRLVVDWTDDQDFTDSNGIAKSVEIQSRVYRPSIEINQGGVYVVDTDIHKARVTGLGIKKEELGVGDITG